MKLLPLPGLSAAGLFVAALFLTACKEQPSVQTTSTQTPSKMSEPKTPEAAKADERQTGDAKYETALVAAGCFWGVEEIFRKIPGVVKTTVGYTGGTTATPTYEKVSTGRTGHAEAIEVVYDPAQVDYASILDLFFRLHDPTTMNRQHNDVGTQYRSAVFYTSEAQKEIAERVKTEQAGIFKKPIVTEITAASTFYSAEDYHQDYLVKNPGGYNCHVLRD
jgi:peptide methionine sulfoxide reductase msrA/msrB